MFACKVRSKQMSALYIIMRATLLLRIGIMPNFDFSLLLGNDFNKAAGFIIDCKNNTISFDSDTKIDRIRTYGRPIHATLSIELKPRASYLLSASVAYRRKSETFTALIRNSPEIYEEEILFESDWSRVCRW